MSQIGQVTGTAPDSNVNMNRKGKGSKQQESCEDEGLSRFGQVTRTAPDSNSCVSLESGGVSNSAVMGGGTIPAVGYGNDPGQNLDHNPLVGSVLELIVAGGKRKEVMSWKCLIHEL